MAELGKLEKPEAEQFQGKRKLYLVPLLYSWTDSPPEYTQKFTHYWEQVREHVANLEAKLGKVRRVYHESVTAPGEEGLKILEKLNSASYQLVKDKCAAGAELELIEDKEIVEESMDWERHLIIGFLSEKVARTVSQFFAESSHRRYEHIAKRISKTLKDGEVGMLVVREGHGIQFPKDIEVFMVAPPSLDDVHRWLRERQAKAEEEEAAEEEKGAKTPLAEPEPPKTEPPSGPPPAQ